MRPPRRRAAAVATGRQALLAHGGRPSVRAAAAVPTVAASSMDVPETLKVLSELTPAVFGCDAVCLFVWEHATEQLRPGWQQGLSRRAAAVFAGLTLPGGVSSPWGRILRRRSVLAPLSGSAADDPTAPLRRGWGSTYAAPLRLHRSRRLYGVLCVLYRALTPIERVPSRSVLRPWCESAAMAISLAQVAEHERAIARRATELSEDLCELTAPRELRAMLERLSQRALPLTGARAAGVMLRDAANGTLRIAALAGPAADFVAVVHNMNLPDLLPRRFPARGYLTVSAEALARLLPVNPDPDDVGSMLTMPVRHDTEIVGVMAVVAHRTVRRFTAQQIRVVRSLADQAAVAVETARLYQRASLLSDLAIAPPYPFVRNRYLGELAARTRGLLGTRICTVWLRDHHASRLELVARSAPEAQAAAPGRARARLAEFAPWQPGAESSSPLRLALPEGSRLGPWTGDGPALLAPIREGAHVLGAFVVTGPANRTDYGDSEARMLTAIADVAAVRLEQQELLRQVARRERELVRHRERERLARDLHDTVLQTLTGINLQLAALQQLGRPAGGAELAALQGAVRDQFSTIQGFLTRLRTNEPHPVDLGAEVRRIVDDYGQRGHLRPHLMVSGVDRVAAPIAHEVASIIREALANVHKHAGTSHVTVSLAARKGHIELRVRDAGRGFPAGTVAGGWVREACLPWSIRERVAGLDGRVRIASRRGRGTGLSIRVPYRDALLPYSRGDRAIAPARSASSPRLVSTSAAIPEPKRRV